MIRSFLFVPGDSLRKFEKARESSADALILDLEDSVSLGAKEEARIETRNMLSSPRIGPLLYVRVNAFDSALTLADLVAVMPLHPDGIVLPKCTGSVDVERLSNYLDAFEASSGTMPGKTRVIAIATETAESVLSLGTFKGESSSRLYGLMWGGEDLAASVGATENRIGNDYTAPFQLARNLCLFAAAAAGVVAIDTVCTTIQDLEYVAFEAKNARRDGFSAKAIIHPSHVAPVNAAFSPSQEELAWARKIIAAFAADSRTGVVKIDGKMIDKPHERAARRILGLENRE